MTIICREHGEFKQTPKTHIDKGGGCPACGGRPRIDTSEFITRSRTQHGDTYDYSCTNYVNQKTFVTIICEKHGAFEQLPHNHMRGAGCPICGFERMADQYRLSADDFISRAREIHGEQYDYSRVKYDTARKPVAIGCPTHGTFEQAPYNHLIGNGCPSCAASGFDIKKPAILYYLRIDRLSDKPVYKIGITNRSVSERFRDPDEKSRITVVESWNYDVGKEALDRETEILRAYKNQRYKGPKILDSGNTEMFFEDVLELDSDR